MTPVRSATNRPTPASMEHAATASDVPEGPSLGSGDEPSVGEADARQEGEERRLITTGEERQATYDEVRNQEEREGRKAGTMVTLFLTVESTVNFRVPNE